MKAVTSGWGLFKRRGRWYGQYRYKDGNRWRTSQRALKDESGNPIRCDPEGNRNKRAAQAALDRWRIATATDPAPRRNARAGWIAADCLKAYVEEKARTVAPSTLRVYREYARMCSPFLDGVTMEDLDRAAVRSALSSMTAAGWSPATVRKAHALISGMCAAAVLDGDISANPCGRDAIAGTTRRKGSPTVNALDPAGALRALEIADGYNAATGTAARLALYAGLRRGECCALQWRDIDLSGRVLHVRRAIQVVEGGTEPGNPKSAAGVRAVPLSAALAAHLQALHDATAAATGLDSADMGQLFVLTSSARHMSPHSLSRAWQRAGDKAGGMVEGVDGTPATFHDLRHTFATTALSAGVDVRTLAALMGHSDPAVTLRHYAAFMPAQGRAAVEDIARAMEE